MNAHTAVLPSSLCLHLFPLFQTWLRGLLLLSSCGWLPYCYCKWGVVALHVFAEWFCIHGFKWDFSRFKPSLIICTFWNSRPTTLPFYCSKQYVPLMFSDANNFNRMISVICKSSSILQIQTACWCMLESNAQPLIINLDNSGTALNCASPPVVLLTSVIESSAAVKQRFIDYKMLLSCF